MTTNGNHVTRAELEAMRRELRLTIIVAIFGAEAVVSYASPVAAGAVAAAALVVSHAKLLAAMFLRG